MCYVNFGDMCDHRSDASDDAVPLYVIPFSIRCFGLPVFCFPIVATTRGPLCGVGFPIDEYYTGSGLLFVYGRSNQRTVRTRRFFQK